MDLRVVREDRWQSTDCYGSRRRDIVLASRRRNRIFDCDWSSDVCSSDLSLIRPAALIGAREKADKGEISDTELNRIQHAAIREVVRLQEELGLKLVTDGEYNRGSWHRD